MNSRPRISLIPVTRKRPISNANALLTVVEQLHETLAVEQAFRRAIPTLCEVVESDYAAWTSSQHLPMRLHWDSTGLPPDFLRGYAACRNQDFVWDAVARRPTTVLRSSDMLPRAQIERHPLYQMARSSASIEEVMSVLIVHDTKESFGISFYRTNKTAFHDEHVGTLQTLVPSLRNAIRNAREHESVLRRARLLEQRELSTAGFLWLNRNLRELERNGAATPILERYFAGEPRENNQLPVCLLSPIRKSMCMAVHERRRLHWWRMDHENFVKIQAIPLEGEEWAIVLETRGLPNGVATRLTPRLVQVALSVLQGMSNPEIARRDGRAVCTIKQQVSEVYGRLGVANRHELMQLVGLGEAPSA